MASGYSDLSEIQNCGGQGSRYGGHLNQKPAKINLLDERPRRESVIEQQLATRISRPTFIQGQQQQNQFSDGSQSTDQHFGPLSHNAGPKVASYGTSRSTQSSFGQRGNQHGATIPSTSTATSAAAYAAQQAFDQLEEMIRSTNTTTSTSHHKSNALQDPSAQLYADLQRDLADKEVRLKRELAHMNERLSPWSRPRQIREPRREPAASVAREQRRWIRECPQVPGGGQSPARSSSRASSTRSTTEAELMDKAAKLLADVEEIQRKPMKTQEILIEPGARRSQSPSGRQAYQQVPSSVHTAIIKVPKGRVDNKSPLPFAYDNFSTLGVRGNIASVGAAPPETPYAPIFPQYKRTPSPAYPK